VLVAYLTLAPALPAWLPGGGNTFKPPAYDALARPLGIFYILVMTACPILAWGGGDWKKLWERAKMPVIIGTVVAAAFVGLYFVAMVPYYTADGNSPVWWHHFIAVLGLVTAGYAVALPVWLFIDGARKRAAATETTFGQALGWILTKARTQSGGYLTHLGMGIILVGLVGSTMFVRTHQAVIPQQPGAEYTAEGYTFTFRDLRETEENIPATGGDGDIVYTLVLDLSKGGRALGEVGSQIRFPHQLRQQNQTTQHVAIHSEVLKDVFVSFSGVDDANNANVTIKFFPMQSWVWVGFGITVIGSALAAWPKRQRAA
jgi:cytochrome c-type biogenesis protein CcmF